MKERWRKQLKFSTIANYDEVIENNKSLASSDPDISLKSEKELEVEARETTRKSLEELYTYMEERQRKDWFGVFINAVVQEFDPHTSYFSPEDKERFDVDMSGKFEGIGARLQRRLDVISISELISGGPAWRQNELEPGDQILKVRQENEDEAINIVGMRIEDAVKYIKGPKGTTVILTVKKADGVIKDISIERDEVVLEETYAKSSTVIKGGKKYGVINLPSFYDNFDRNNRISSALDVKKEIERLKEDGIEGVILDLRDNGGGRIAEIEKLYSYLTNENYQFITKSEVNSRIPFLKAFMSNTTPNMLKVLGGLLSPIVITQNLLKTKKVDGKLYYKFKESKIKEPNPLNYKGRLYVLINGNSFSASSLLATHLKVTKRATFVGEETGGAYNGTVAGIYKIYEFMKFVNLESLN